jgi:hypothetical protein
VKWLDRTDVDFISSHTVVLLGLVLTGLTFDSICGSVVWLEDCVLTRTSLDRIDIGFFSRALVGLEGYKRKP